jgi:hypothetical protein
MFATHSPDSAWITRRTVSSEFHFSAWKAAGKVVGVVMVVVSKGMGDSSGEQGGSAGLTEPPEEFQATTTLPSNT